MVFVLSLKSTHLLSFLISSRLSSSLTWTIVIRPFGPHASYLSRFHNFPSPWRLSMFFKHISITQQPQNTLSLLEGWSLVLRDPSCLPTSLPKVIPVALSNFLSFKNHVSLRLPLKPIPPPLYFQAALLKLILSFYIATLHLPLASSSLSLLYIPKLDHNVWQKCSINEGRKE